MRYKNLLYILACLSFSTIIGAAVYEHTALWPNAFAELPRSLAVFQGEYKLDSAPFWMWVHPVTLLLLVINVILHRRSERNKYLLISMTMYIIILLVTFIYFVPELMRLVNMPYANSVDTAASNRADMWVNLSLVRLAVLVVAALVLYSGLTKTR